MFPINYNDPYLKEDGSIVPVSDVVGGESELPEYGVDDAGKILSVDDTGELEWIENGGGGGTTTITDIPFASFPYTATEKGFVSVFFMGSSTTGANYYENVTLNGTTLLVPNTYGVAFNNKTCSILIPVNVGDIVDVPGNHQYISNTFNAKFIKS